MLCVLLPGCALGPGYGSTGNYRPSDVGKPVQQTGAGAGAAAVAPADGAADRGELVAITPELVRRLYQQRPTDIPADVRALLGTPPAYTLGPGDVIGVAVMDHPELVDNTVPATTVADPASVSPAPGYIIAANGRLSFPYAGQIPAAGMTVDRLQEELTKRLGRVFRDPQVTVRVQAFRSKRAYVEGHVRTPGLQVFTDMPMTLPEAINRAGGITQEGDRSLVELTRGNTTTKIDLMLLGEMGVDPGRIPLQNGDLVMVRARDERKVFVMGEVLQPSALQMRNGRLTLNEALGEAGGVNLTTADPRQIYVVRHKTMGAEPTVFHLDGRDATSLALAENFPLAPRDVVYVDPVAVARWNRVVSLILPSAQSANLIRGTYK